MMELFVLPSLLHCGVPMAASWRTETSCPMAMFRAVAWTSLSKEVKRRANLHRMPKSIIVKKSYSSSGVPIFEEPKLIYGHIIIYVVT
jgi:hypothetical protein